MSGELADLDGDDAYTYGVSDEAETRAMWVEQGRTEERTRIFDAAERQSDGYGWVYLPSFRASIEGTSE